MAAVSELPVLKITAEKCAWILGRCTPMPSAFKYVPCFADESLKSNIKCIYSVITENAYSYCVYIYNNAKECI